MSTRKTTAAAVAAVAGLLCAGYAVDARAALEESTLETAATPEIANVAVEIALVIEALDAAADEGDIVAAVHEHIAASAYPEGVVASALELMLEGDWSDVQHAAIASLFSSYAEEDVQAVAEGEDADELAAEEGARTDEDLASKLATIANGNSPAFPSAAGDIGAPAPAAPAPAAEDEDDTSTVEPVSVTDNLNPPPPPQVTGGSDYDL